MRKKMMGGGMSNRTMYKNGSKSKKEKIKIVGVGKAKDYPGIKKIIEMNKKGKKRFAGGGSALKEVDKEKNPGLSKLPTKVRNNMGFMSEGGKVSNRTNKFFGGAVRLGSAGLKYLKNNPDKVKKIMDSDLPKKTKDILSKLKKTYSKKKKD